MLAKKQTLQAFDQMQQKLALSSLADDAAALSTIKTLFDERVAQLKTDAKQTGEKLSNVFRFCEAAFGSESQEVLILVTELTISRPAARFLSRYGCPEYFAHNKELLFYERQMELIAELDNLEL